MSEEVIFKPGDRVVCINADHAGGKLAINHEYTVKWAGSRGRLITLEELAHGYNASRFMLVPAKKPKTFGARWYVIDSTNDTLVAVGLSDRAAGIEWIKSFGNTSHRYVVAKETGEFVCTRTVAEV